VCIEDPTLPVSGYTHRSIPLTLKWLKDCLRVTMAATSELNHLYLAFIKNRGIDSRMGTQHMGSFNGLVLRSTAIKHGEPRIGKFTFYSDKVMSLIQDSVQALPAPVCGFCQPWDVQNLQSFGACTYQLPSLTANPLNRTYPNHLLPSSSLVTTVSSTSQTSLTTASSFSLSPRLSII